MVPRSIFSSSVWKPLPRGANPSMAGMFSGATVLASYPFHVTRDSDIELDEDDEDDENGRCDGAGGRGMQYLGIRCRDLGYLLDGCGGRQQIEADRTRVGSVRPGGVERR